jgi:sugar phosphate isomerase/epimerase
MSLSTLPLSYCTNVHPGRTLAEVEAGLDRYTVPVKSQYAEPLAAGLWLARPVIAELLATADGITRFSDRIRQRGLTCHTLNAFPYGDFHSERVKENVYLPDWTKPERLAYTLGCAKVLAGLLADGVEGSISTLPLGFREFAQPAGFREACATQITACAQGLAKIHAETGKRIRLAIEPEPFCILETTSQAIEFFRQFDDAVREHVGLCFDVCHQAVEYENVAESIDQLGRAGVRINKVHVSCALQLDHPKKNAEGRAALMHYVEPRYLHQTMASPAVAGDDPSRAVDLTHELIESPNVDFLAAESWRVHFHVPVDAERIGPLGTTRPALKSALRAVAKLDYAPHLEVETYTWDVLPGAHATDLASNLARELIATRKLLADVRSAD